MASNTLYVTLIIDRYHYPITYFWWHSLIMHQIMKSDMFESNTWIFNHQLIQSIRYYISEWNSISKSEKWSIVLCCACPIIVEKKFKIAYQIGKIQSLIAQLFWKMNEFPFLIISFCVGASKRNFCYNYAIKNKQGEPELVKLNFVFVNLEDVYSSQWTASPFTIKFMYFILSSTIN